jgi:hypothetical protein
MKKMKGSRVVLDFANAKSGLAGTIRQAVALFLSLAIGCRRAEGRISSSRARPKEFTAT